MFPFAVDHRPVFDCSLTLYHATKHAVRANTRGRSTPSTTGSTITAEHPAPHSSAATMYPISSGSGNSFRNPYAFTSPRPTYSSARSKTNKPGSFGTTSSNTSTNSNTDSNGSTSTASSATSTASTKSRLAAINSAYDSEYGCHDGCTTAEEIRQVRASQDRALKEFEAGAGASALPESMLSGASSGSRSSPSTSQSSSDVERVSSPRKMRRRFTDRFLRRSHRRRSQSGSGSDDEDLLVGEGR